MDVVGHQAIADQGHTVSLDAPMKQIEVNTFLGIPFQDEAPLIAALRDVMSNAWRNHPGESNHLSPRRTTLGAPGARLTDQLPRASTRDHVQRNGLTYGAANR
jgi:hypothetical protein